MPVPHHSVFLQAWCSSCYPTNSIKALKAIILIITRNVGQCPTWWSVVTLPNIGGALYSTPQSLADAQYYTVSQKNVRPLACYNFDTHEWILIFFGRNVTDKVGNQKTLYYVTSNNMCFCTTWQNAETRKSHISLNWIVLHTQCACALSSWQKKLSSVMCLIASNICWGSKISN